MRIPQDPEALLRVILELRASWFIWVKFFPYARPLSGLLMRYKLSIEKVLGGALALNVEDVLLKPKLVALAYGLRAHAPLEADTKHIIKTVVINLKAFQQLALIGLVTVFLALWGPQNLLVQLDRQVL